MEFIDKLQELKTFNAFDDILNGYELADFQSVDLLIALYVKRTIIRYDTGMGKTLIASALMKLLKREDSSRKFIMVIQNGQLVQTPKKIRECSGLKVLALSSAQSSIKANLYNKDFLDYDVILITQECLLNQVVMETLYRYRKSFCGLIIDEAHELTNFEEASTAFMIRSMAPNFEFVYALTATPITTSAEQLTRLMHILDRKAVPNPRQEAKVLLAQPDLLQEYKGMIISRTRNDLGIASTYVPHVCFINPLPHQVHAHGLDLFNITKGEGAYPQVKELINIIKNNRPGKGLVYIHRHATREFVVKELAKEGITFECINGKTSMSERGRIMNDFNAGKIDTILTSATTALDLDCDYIVFYEFTVNVKQMMGRGHRGLNPKTLHMYFIFTKRTEEPIYFIRNIFMRSLIIRVILNLDFKEILAIAMEIEKELELEI